MWLLKGLVVRSLDWILKRGTCRGSLANKSIQILDSCNPRDVVSMFRVVPKILSKACLPRKTKHTFGTDFFAFFLFVGHGSQNQIFNTLQWGNSRQDSKCRQHIGHMVSASITHKFLYLSWGRTDISWRSCMQALHSYSHQPHGLTVNHFFSLFLSWVTTARSREDESRNGHWNATQYPNPN